MSSIFPRPDRTLRPANLHIHPAFHRFSPHNIPATCRFSLTDDCDFPNSHRRLTLSRLYRFPAPNAEFAYPRPVGLAGSTYPQDNFPCW
jgi:hypothetical protein